MTENERLKTLREQREAKREAEYQAKADAYMDKLCEVYPDVPATALMDAFNAGHALGYDEGYNDAPSSW